MSERECVVDPFRQFLLKLSRELTAENVEELKYLCEDALGVAAAERCKTARDVFKELNYLGKIMPNNLDSLKELMLSITRRDLVDLIGNFLAYILFVNCVYEPGTYSNLMAPSCLARINSDD